MKIKNIRLALLIVITCFIWKGIELIICSKNANLYNINTVTELNESEFVAAFKQLTRLMPETHRSYVPIPQEAMIAASKVSFSFKEIYPELELQFDGNGWSAYGCGYMNICDELAGGWAVWAIREAAYKRGFFADGKSSSEFFSSVANELKNGCENGKLSCSNNMTGNYLAPPILFEDLPRIAQSLCKIFYMLITFKTFEDKIVKKEEEEASIEEASIEEASIEEASKEEDFSTDEKNISANLQFPTELIERYGKLTHSRWPGWVSFGGTYSKSMFFIYKLFNIAGSLFIVIALTFTIIPVVISVVISVSISASIFMIKYRKSTNKKFQSQFGIESSLFYMFCFMGIMIFSRILIVSYIDAMSFYAQLRYLVAVYPVFVGLITLSAFIIINQLKCLFNNFTSSITRPLQSVAPPPFQKKNKKNNNLKTKSII
ncbi:MAG: hypothetical protein HQK65_22180 [Desulfamplus sp.]|nr:hypothetical protein [Desulfamplus sp.]